MSTKEIILAEYNGRYCSIDDIVAFVSKNTEKIDRRTVVWNVDDIVKKGKAIRVGRGVYGFIEKPQFEPRLSETALKVCDIIKYNNKYLKITVLDTTCLNQFMNLQPFSSVIAIELNKVAVEAVLSTLINNDVEAFTKSNFGMLEKYVRSTQPIIISGELSTNPKLSCINNVCYANLEKLLVDLVCDEKIYIQYQGQELENIYRNSTAKYAVNYSQMFKYAGARKRRTEVEALLLKTEEYKKVRDLL